MKKTILTSITILFILLQLTGCSSKYQTNKLPDEDKITLPKKVEKRKYYLNEDLREDFKKYVINEFDDGMVKKQSNKNNEKTEMPKNIWIQGYEIDKKRY